MSLCIICNKEKEPWREGLTMCETCWKQKKSEYYKQHKKGRKLPTAWVSCKEVQPDKSGYYLGYITGTNARVREVYFVKGRYFIVVDDCNWAETHDGEVAYWMPFPEPPEEVRKCE